MRVFSTFEEITAAVGEPLGVTEWTEMTQERVDRFAEATGDDQWIHVDVERAKDGPFGGTIAHGYLTLSLVPWLGSQIYAIQTPGAKLNYGLNKVRFPTPLLVGKRIRGTATFTEAKPMATGLQVTITYTVEIEGEAKPACVAETLVLLLEG